jgi:prevent-host-death family protein
MKSMGVAKFKEQCLRLLDELEPEGLIITKHGVPVAKLMPYEKQSAELIGSLEGQIEVRGDIFGTGLDWESGAQP